LVANVSVDRVLCTPLLDKVEHFNLLLLLAFVDPLIGHEHSLNVLVRQRVVLGDTASRDPVEVRNLTFVVSHSRLHTF